VTPPVLTASAAEARPCESGLSDSNLRIVAPSEFVGAPAGIDLRLLDSWLAKPRAHGPRSFTCAAAGGESGPRIAHLRAAECFQFRGARGATRVVHLQPTAALHD